MPPAVGAGHPPRPGADHKHAAQTGVSQSRPSNISLFLTNLRLLDLDCLPDWPDISLQTLGTKDATQNQKKRIQCVEWALYQLFLLWDAETARNKLQPFFPPLEPLQSLNLRAALFRCLSDLKKDGVLGREVILRKTMLDECKGERFEEVLVSFSTAVLKRQLAKVSNGQGSIARKLAISENVSTGSQAQLEALILAHRVSLARKLKLRADQTAKWEDLASLLNLKDRRITRREEELKSRSAIENGNPTIDEAERARAEQVLKDSWLGNRQWLDIILRGDEQQASDLTLESSFESIWQRVKNNDLGSIEDRRKVGLCEDLDRRVKDQKQRLQTWKAFKDDFTRRQKKSKGEKQSDQEKPAVADPQEGFGFKEHIDITWKPNKTPNAGGVQPERAAAKVSTPLGPDHEFGRLISALESELAKAGASRQRGGSGWRVLNDRLDSLFSPKHDPLYSEEEQEELEDSRKISPDIVQTQKGFDPTPETAIDEESEAEDQEPPVAQESPPSSPPHDEKSILKDPHNQPTINLEELETPEPDLPPSNSIPCSNSTSRKSTRLSLFSNEDQDFLAEQIISSVTEPSPMPAKKPTRTLAERTRMSMGFSDLQDLDATMAPPPLPSQQPIVEEPDEAFDRRASLLERTRRSMSLLSTTANTSRKPPRKSAVPRKVYPVNQFETPQKGGHLRPPGGGEDQEDDEGMVDSRASTPREDLFSQEADYASVFKSRPKIAVSPTITPIGPGGGAGGNEVLGELEDEASGDDDYEGGWKASPLLRNGRGLRG